MCVAVKSLCKKGEDCMEGVAGAGSPWSSLLLRWEREKRDSRLMPSDVLNVAFRGDTPFLRFAYDSATMLVLMSVASLKTLFLRQL